MSVYANIIGELKFNTKSDYGKAVQILKEGGWISGNSWVDESGAEVEEFESATLKISIPRNNYRNLLHVLDSIIKYASFYDIVWASADGMFDGGIISSGGNKNYDLNEWAIANCCQAKPVEDSSDEDSYYEELTQWQEAAIESFLDSPEG